MITKHYKQSGVDIDLADRFVERIKKIVKPTLSAKVKTGVGGFASLYELSRDLYVAASTDGVGTKVKLATDLGNHRGIGQDLVAMCVNDLICTGARPLFFLDYFATGKLDLKVGVEIIRSIARACRFCGMSLVGGETAEMPQVYAPGIYDLAGFAVGMVTKKTLITGKTLKDGDLLIGLASSGVHSNGYSLVRKIFDVTETKWMRLLMKPTVLYAPSVLAFHEKNPGIIKGIAHITGSGFLNIPRINENFDYIISHRPPRPMIFREILRRTGMSEEEAFHTFNMGAGMVLVVSPHQLNVITHHFFRYKIPAFPLGYVQKGRGRFLLR